MYAALKKDGVGLHNLHNLEYDPGLVWGHGKVNFLGMGPFAKIAARCAILV